MNPDGELIRGVPSSRPGATLSQRPESTLTTSADMASWAKPTIIGASTPRRPTTPKRGCIATPPRWSGRSWGPGGTPSAGWQSATSTSTSASTHFGVATTGRALRVVSSGSWPFSVPMVQMERIRTVEALGTGLGSFEKGLAELYSRATTISSGAHSSSTRSTTMPSRLFAT